jgi:long-chain acyl-CoA synthetase
LTERLTAGDGIPVPRAFEAIVASDGDRTAQRWRGSARRRSLGGLDGGGRAADAPDGLASFTYAGLADVVRRLSVGFRTLGVRAGDRVVLAGPARPEWTAVDLALLSAGAVVVPVRPDATPEHVSTLASARDVHGLVVGDRDALGALAPATIDAVLGPVVSLGETGVHDRRVSVFDLLELYERGHASFDREAHERRLAAIDPADPATERVVPDSDGVDRRVVLDHGTLAAGVAGVRARFPDAFAGGTTLVHRPPAAGLERVVGHLGTLAAGGTVAYAEGDGPAALARDLRASAPDVVTTTPEALASLFEHVRGRLDDGGRGRPSTERAVAAARERVRAGTGVGGAVRHRLYDRLVYRRLREAFGHPSVVCCEGRADRRVTEALAGAGVPVHEAYGVARAAGFVAVAPPGEAKPGSVGPPVETIEARLDASVTPSRAFEDVVGDAGELLVRGPPVAAAGAPTVDAPDGGEARDEGGRATGGSGGNAGDDDRDGDGNGAEARDADADANEDADPNADADANAEGSGWVRTGDVVQERPDGYLVVREHVGGGLVLSTGRRVAPGPVADALTSSEYVRRCALVGEDRPYVAALIVPAFDVVRRWADHEAVDLPASPAAICDDDRVRSLLEHEVGDANDLFEPHERIAAFRLVPGGAAADGDDTGVDRDRRGLRDRYADLVTAMYEE